MSETSPSVVDQNASLISIRQLHPGMGQAVAERTVLRKVFDYPDGELAVSDDDPNKKLILMEARKRGRHVDVDRLSQIPHWPWRFETWGEVSNRVAFGNASLLKLVGADVRTRLAEYDGLREHLMRGSVLMSGRHLQHGDADQPNRNMEVFTNCATAPASFLLFLLLLNGAGVGRCYDDDMMLVNWDDAPSVRCVIDENHADYDSSAHESKREALHRYGGAKDVLWFEVPDTREGWAQALEVWETAAHERVHRDKLLVLDFSEVRPSGEAIAGMQGRPSSGPVPVMNAFAKGMTIRGAGLPKWEQAMHIDHYFAECVLVGGARRAARMSTKHWMDPSVLDFIAVKRPVEYQGLSPEEVAGLRRGCVESGHEPPRSFLWSSNDSVAVDETFWRYVNATESEISQFSCGERRDADWAVQVFDAVTRCAYYDGTGEPGFINVDKLVQKDDGWEDLFLGDYVGSARYQPRDNTAIYLSRLARKAKAKDLHMITNPCGEIALNLLGGYCVLADVVPFHCEPPPSVATERGMGAYYQEWDDRAEDAVRVATRALIRTNLMDSIYHKEVRRTNRIGVSLTGVHEWAFARFGLGFRSLLNEDGAGYPFWSVIRRLSLAVQDEAMRYSAALGITVPHTMLTMKPSGTTSKLFGLTEGAHLPSMPFFVRWVQFRNDDPLVEQYRASGYLVRVLEVYRGHTIVGFPTAPTISGMGMGDSLVLAGEATMEEQFLWLQLLEKNWLEGGRDDGPQYGNEISYTLKYRPQDVPFEDFQRIILDYQGTVRCCTVMPQEEAVAYEYQPEEPVTEVEYERLCWAIEDLLAEDVDHGHLDCAGGACPIEYGVKGEAHLGMQEF